MPAGSVAICTRTSSNAGGNHEEQTPEGMIRAFRKWDDNVVRRNCKVLSLSAALEATGP